MGTRKTFDQGDTFTVIKRVNTFDPRVIKGMGGRVKHVYLSDRGRTVYVLEFFSLRPYSNNIRFHQEYFEETRNLATYFVKTNKAA